MRLSPIMRTGGKIRLRYSCPHRVAADARRNIAKEGDVTSVCNLSFFRSAALIGAVVGAASAAQAQSAIDLDTLTATQAAADLCAGKYTSEALVSAVLARAKARPELNAFITLDEAAR